MLGSQYIFTTDRSSPPQLSQIGPPYYLCPMTRSSLSPYISFSLPTVALSKIQPQPPHILNSYLRNVTPFTHVKLCV